MHSTSYWLSGLLSQMLLQPILFPLGFELLGRGLPDILEPVLQVADLVHAHEARNSTLHRLALARLLHYLLGDFVLGLEDFFLDEFGGHCIKFIKSRQLFLKQSYLLIQLRETLLKHLVLLISLRQLLIQFLLLFLKPINFLNCFLGVLDQGLGDLVDHELLQLPNNQLLHHLILLSLLHILILHLVVHLPGVACLRNVALAALIIAQLPIDI